MKTLKIPRLVCAKCGQSLAENIVRKCPHEAVTRILGEHICAYCCRKCKHHTKHPMCGAIGCELWKKEERKR